MNQNVHITNLPDLLEIQRSSFCWFLSEGLAQELAKFSSIFDLTGNVELRVYGHEYRLKKPKLSTSKAKEKNITYSVKLYVSIELLTKNHCYYKHYCRKTQSFNRGNTFNDK